MNPSRGTAGRVATQPVQSNKQAFWYECFIVRELYRCRCALIDSGLGFSRPRFKKKTSDTINAEAHTGARITKSPDLEVENVRKFTA